MPDIPLRDLIENLRSRLQTELEAELAQLADNHEQELAATRRAATAEAEQQWAQKLAAAEADWNRRLESEVQAARADAERRAIADATRARMEAEQAAAEAAAVLRREMEEAAAAERQQAASELERATAEQDRLASEQARLAAEQRRAEQELAAARAELDAERARAAEAIEVARRTAPTLDASRLLSALAAIDAANSLTEVIRAAVSATRAEAPRATFFVVNGAQLDEWKIPGSESLSPTPMRVEGRDAGFLAETLRRGEPLVTGDDGPPPSFAALPQGKRALAVPFVFGGEPVAILYADEAGNGQAQDGWIDAVQVIGRHGSATAACITARRTAEALRAIADGPQSAASAGASDDIEQGARRYARLLVSEIKLYNEPAVRTGRQKRDLLQRLKPEIERARRLFEERVSPAVPGRDGVFQQELVQTLADGDASLLG